MSTNEIVTEETRQLFTAAEKGDTNGIKTLLGRDGTNTDWRNGPKGGATALHAAVSGGNDKAAALLLEAGADMHIKITLDLNTPLHLACSLKAPKNMVMVKMLVEKGADMSIENQYGNTPVHTACLAGANDIVQYLIDNGSDVNYANHLKSTPLHFTLYNDKENVDLVNYLLSKGATLEAEDSEGATPLLVAATKGHQKAASIFKDGGADPNHYDKQGNNAVSLALRRGHTKLAQFLGGEGGVSIFSAPTTAPGKGSTKQPVSAKEAPKSPEAPKIKKKGGFFRKRK